MVELVEVRSEARAFRSAWPWYLLTLVLVCLDQASKQMASASLDYGQQLQVTGFFNWTLLHNTGAAFSFLSDAGGWQNVLFAVIASLVGAYIVFWIYREPQSGKGQKCGLALILSGAVGNLVDRLLHGYVIDFIQLHYRDYYWPAFNVADSAICVGAALLMIQALRQPAETAS